MTWQPFPQALADIPREALEDISNLNHFLTDVSSNEPADFASCLSALQPSKIRKLEDNLKRDDEELEYAVLGGDSPVESSGINTLQSRWTSNGYPNGKQERDVISLLEECTSHSKDRAYRSIEKKDLDAKIKARVASATSIKPLKRRVESTSPRRNTRRKLVIPETSLLTTSFSTSGALSNFIEHRAEAHNFQRPKLHDSRYFAVPTSPPPASPSLSNSRITPVDEERKPAPRPLTPDLYPPTRPRPFVISSSFLEQHALVRRIQHLYPSAELLSRSASRANGQHPSANTVHPLDADLILSPSHAIVTTTLQGIKQRSLLSQTRNFLIRDRIAAFAPSYERLFILVSEARRDDGSRPLDPRDSEAVESLAAFATPIGAHVTFIEGGLEELAIQIAKLMIKHGREATLILEETCWERILRNNGLNAYTAMVVLVETRRRLDTGKDKRQTCEWLMRCDDHEWGDALAAFGEMGSGARRAMFEELLGGRKLLRKIENVIADAQAF